MGELKEVHRRRRGSRLPGALYEPACMTIGIQFGGGDTLGGWNAQTEQVYATTKRSEQPNSFARGGTESPKICTSQTSILNLHPHQRTLLLQTFLWLHSGRMYWSITLWTKDTSNLVGSECSKQSENISVFLVDLKVKKMYDDLMNTSTRVLWWLFCSLQHTK